MTADSTAGRFESAVERFEASAPWLGDPHAPALVTLRVLAETLDAGNLTPALVAQFGLTFRSLAKLAPPIDAADDPLTAALRGAGAA